MKIIVSLVGKILQLLMILKGVNLVDTLSMMDEDMHVKNPVVLPICYADNSDIMGPAGRSDRILWCLVKKSHSIGTFQIKIISGTSSRQGWTKRRQGSRSFLKVPRCDTPEARGPGTGTWGVRKFCILAASKHCVLGKGSEDPGLEIHSVPACIITHKSYVTSVGFSLPTAVNS